MPEILYSSVDRKGYVNAASLTRWRSRYRGHRESYKMNEESAATLYDFRRLFETYSDLEAELTTNLNTIEDGGAISGTQVKWGSDPLANISLLGIDKLNTRLTALRERLNLLER